MGSRLACGLYRLIFARKDITWLLRRVGVLNEVMIVRRFRYYAVRFYYITRSWVVLMAVNGSTRVTASLILRTGDRSRRL